MKKLKVTAVSYLNTKPFLYGLLKEGLHEKIDLQLDIPSRCAEKMRTGEAQLGLIPVAAIPEIAGAQIVSDYCIGTVSAVKTVCIYANQPIQQLSHLYLDFHSRTSVELTKILLRQYWKIDPILIPAKEGYISKISDKVGGLVIGDRTIGLEHQFEYVYDLGEMWEKLTGLPFVFAAWVSTVPLSSKFIATFNKALKVGLMSIPDLLYLLQAPHPDFDLATYFNQYISYELDEKKKTAMRLFWREMAVNTKYEHQINTTVNSLV
jgi:chorismate dehydratase